MNEAAHALAPRPVGSSPRPSEACPRPLEPSRPALGFSPRPLEPGRPALGFSPGPLEPGRPPRPAPAPMRLAVAPMMDRTDRHCRYFLRLLAPSARLYTEMITAAALVHGPSRALLAFDPAEHPVALQLGGGDPGELAAAARLGAAAGYDEINLNVGCPSGRVQAGCFGAALMREPERVAACVRAMREAVDVPVTVKTRLGVDECEDYAFLADFVGRVAEAGCGTFVVHARKAWLRGLSPKQNREIPPLDYARVHRLKRDFPALEVVLNGGLGDAGAALAELRHVDGVMLGRAAYADPFLLARLDAAIFGEFARHDAAPHAAARHDAASHAAARHDAASHETARRVAAPHEAARCEAARHPAARYAAAPHEAAPRSRLDALLDFVPYLEREVARGTPLKSMTRHLLGLFAGMRGGRGWRRMLGQLPSEPRSPPQAAASIAALVAAARRLSSSETARAA